MNPRFSNGMRGLLSCDHRMAEIVRSGGTVSSQLPDFPVIQKTRVTWYESYNPKVM